MRRAHSPAHRLSAPDLRNRQRGAAQRGVPGDKVLLRQKPSAKAKAIGVIERGERASLVATSPRDRITVDEQTLDDKWFQVKTAAGKTGWVFSHYFARHQFTARATKVPGQHVLGWSRDYLYAYVTVEYQGCACDGPSIYFQVRDLLRDKVVVEIEQICDPRHSLEQFWDKHRLDIHHRLDALGVMPVEDPKLVQSGISLGKRHRPAGFFSGLLDGTAPRSV